MHNHLNLVAIMVGYRYPTISPDLACGMQYNIATTANSTINVGLGVVRELLRRIVCLEWCKSAVYEVRYAREVEKGKGFMRRREGV